jgi:4-amino-4-deoxy-L-arabinose transferase-like glycosyltransferase
MYSVPPPLKYKTRITIPHSGMAIVHKTTMSWQTEIAPAPFIRWNKSTKFSVLAVIFTIIGIARICATYPVFSQTYDEPANIAAGMQWLTTGEFTYEVQHPPLARVATAVGPYLAGLRSQGVPSIWLEGNAILHAGGSYFRNLALARAGMLPFFVLATMATWLLANRLYGSRTAALAALLFTSMPVILGHSAVAGNDIPVMAGLIALAYTSLIFFERPTLQRAVLLGIAGGVAILCKFSAFVFGLPILAAIGWISFRSGVPLRPFRTRWIKPLAIAGLACMVTIWSGYRFSIKPIRPPDRPGFALEQSARIPNALQPIATALLDTPVPGSELIRGLGAVALHNAHGHPSYLLGEVRTQGWWYFYPIVLLVKTPLAVLLLAIIGALWGLRLGRSGTNALRWIPLACASIILLLSLSTHINVGVRYILPLYPFLAILAAVGANTLIESSASRAPKVVAIALVTWFLASSVASHPDYLAYFNELAVGEPSRVLGESDLDWGQDLNRLSLALKRHGVAEVALAYSGSASIESHDLPRIVALEPYVSRNGWIAISEYHLRITSRRLQQETGRATGAYDWLLQHKPVEIVGKSIRLYHLKAGL